MTLRDKLKFWILLSSYVEMIVRGTSPVSLPNAIADSLEYLKAFGGTEQRNLPDGYIERQYIYMMDGSYLLTDIVPTYDGHYEMDFQTTTVSNVAAAYLGGRAGQSPAGLIFSHGSGNVLVTDAFGQRYSIAYKAENNTRYKYVFNNKVFTLYKNGEVVETYTFTSSADSGAALAIKAINTGDSIDFTGEGIYLYGFKAWDNQGNLIADYVPAVQKGTVPVVGFYDTVSGTFKTATAGTFVAGGEAVPTPDAPMDIISNNGVVKVNSSTSGKNAIDTSDIQNGYLTSTIGNTPVINGSSASMVIKSAIKVSAGKSYKFSYVSNIAGNREEDIVGSDGNVKQTILHLCGVGLNEYTITPQCDGELWLTVQQGTLEDVNPICYEIGEIYTDGTVETINVHGKNLFDKNQTYIPAFVNANTGELTAASPNQRSFVVNCLPNTTYTISGMTAASGWGSFTSSAIGTTATSFTAGNGTITTGANDKYLIGLAYVNGSSIYDYRNTLQLERGSTATAYEEYYDGGTATAEMLLKVGNYEDVQEILSGVVTRNVGVKVLDGTETGWVKLSGTNYVSLPKTTISNMVSGTDATCLSNNFVQVPHGSISLSEERFSVGASYVNFKKSGNPTAAQFKQWLANQYAAGTPVIVIYPLATPTTESVAGQTMQVQQGDNVVEITQASMSNLQLEAKYKKGA